MVESRQISTLSEKFQLTKDVSPMIWRSEPENHKNQFRRFAESLAPKAAIYLKNEINPDQYRAFPELKKYVSFYQRAQKLLVSIEGATSPRTLPVMARMMDWVDFNDFYPDDITVNDAIKRSLGLYAFRQSLLIVNNSKGKIEGSGIIKDYLDMCARGKEDHQMLDKLAISIPVLSKSSKDVVAKDGKLEDINGSLDLIDSAMIEQGLRHRIPEIVKNLTLGSTLAKMWSSEGLANKQTPVLKPTLSNILTIARYYGWQYLSDGVTDKESEDYVNWESDRDSVLGLSKNLSQEEQKIVADELTILEDGLYEDDLD